jgi:hypothetical protein
LEEKMRNAMLIFIITIILVFTFFYIFYPINLLPMPVGWDTPRYIWQMRAVAENLDFIAKIDFNNFIYILLGSLFVRLGVDAFIVELLLPPTLLLTLLIETLFFLTRLQPGKNWWTYILMAISWFSAYRVAADLHNNLLALNILLPSVYTFYLYLRKGKKRCLGVLFFLFILSSFTHIESTLFLTFILILSVFINKDLGKIRKVVIASLLIVAILPATAFYYFHIEKLLKFSGGSFGKSTMELWRWIIYLGPAGFIGIYQLVSEIWIKFADGDFLRKFFAVWGFVSILFGLIQYLEPSFMLFSERAVILFPAPFLAIHKVKEIDPRIILGKNYCWRKKLKFSVPILTASFNILIILSMNFYNIHIHPQAYRDLLFLREKFPNKPIILVVDYSDRYAGEIGQHINDWGKVVVGNMYVYVGNIYYLRDWMPTPFFYWSSRQASNILFQEICSNFQSLNEAVVIYGLDFTEFTVLPEDYKEFMEYLRDDLYVVNLTKLYKTPWKLVIPVFQHSKVIYGNWRLSDKSWEGEYQFVYECWMIGNIPQPPAIEVLFAVKEEGSYSVSLSFWADDTTSLQVQVDGSQPQVFNGTRELDKEIVFTGFLYEGEHLLKVALSSPTLVNDNYLHARLNFLEVSKAP